MIDYLYYISTGSCTKSANKYVKPTYNMYLSIYITTWPKKRKKTGQGLPSSGQKQAVGDNDVA